MIYRVCIVCLFIILCIFLIYFALKNKQIETFDTSKRTIVKTANNDYGDSLNVFSYDGSSIVHVNKFDDNAIGLFYDYNASGDPKLVHKKSTDNIIQIINVFISTTDIKKTVYLKDDGTVYYKNSDGTQIITDLSDIIQIAPNDNDYFIALTSYNTLIRYNVTNTNPNPGNKIELEETDPTDPTDPIVSIQGFKSSATVMYLTMSGDLKYFKSDDSQIGIQIPAYLTNKVIQFNIPTYSEFNGTSPPFSCIALDGDNNSFVKFYNIGSPSPEPLTLINATMITTLVIQSSDGNYECYVVTNEGHLFNFSDDVNDYELTDDKYIDSDVKNVIAVNNIIYYVKDGDINCDSMDTDDRKWFPSSEGNRCVTCGINTVFTDLSPKKSGKPVKAGDGDCKCSDDNTHATKDEKGFKAESNEEGCRNYQSCPPITGNECGSGLFSSNIQFELGEDAETTDGEALICPICVPCSKTADEAFKRKPGSIKYGSKHPDNPDNIRFGSPCYDGKSDGNCQYYISQTCTPISDTVFAKRTVWDDLNNSNQYSVTLAGERQVNQFKQTEYGTEPSNNAQITYPDDVNGMPATLSNLTVGQDDTFLECIQESDCANLGSTDITADSFKLVSGKDNQRYDCTNGYKRICDNCSDKYQCTESIYDINFKDDSSTDINLNHLLQYCGERGEYTDDFEDFKLDKPALCPADTSTSVCPDLFSSTPCPIGNEFINCENLFPP